MASTVRPGRATPLGCSLVSSDGISVTLNFALHAGPSVRLSLCIFPPLASGTVTRDLAHDPIPVSSHTGNVWHVEVSGVDRDAAYAYHVSGVDRLLLDPIARYVESRPAGRWGMYEGEDFAGDRDKAGSVQAFIASFPRLRRLGIKYPFVLGLVCEPEDSRMFDWEDDKPPEITMEDTVIYEASVRGLTASLEGGEGVPGTFGKACERFGYLKWLGATALQLLPVGEFNEIENDSMDDLKVLRGHVEGDSSSGERKLNVWGMYGTGSFVCDSCCIVWTVCAKDCGIV